MEVKPIGPLVNLLTSDQDLQKEINALDAQMQGKQGTPEYYYDLLHLEIEQEEQKIRKENPNLNPLNPDDSNKLDELLAQDPTYQSICNQLHQLEGEFASEVPAWGIPFYPTTSEPA